MRPARINPSPGRGVGDILVSFKARCWRESGVSWGRYVLVIGSVQAALSCATSERNLPEGFTPIGQSVHSHPRTKAVRPTYADQEIQRQTHVRSLPYREVENNKGARGFSPEDVAHGPGYLVAAGRVLH